MQSSGKAYFTGALGVAASRVINSLAGIVSLWLLTAILTTDNFAGYSVAMSIVVLLGYSAGLGLERSMLLRVGELAPDPRILAGARLALTILGIVAVLSTVTAVLTFAFIGGGGTTPRHEFVARLAPVIPATALSLVMVTWYQANHRVGVSQVMLGLNDATRAAVFAITLVLGLGPAGVAAGAFIGAAAPLAYLSIRAVGNTRPEPHDLGIGDVLAGFQFLIMRLSKMGLHHFDIIALGALGSATGTAQYVVASRFAILVESGQTIFSPTFAPRVRRHLTTGRGELASREYHVARVAGFTAALAFSMFLVLFGQPILQAFGNFGVGFGAFMILVATNLLTVGVGMHSTFLSMTDQLSRSTANRILSLGVFGLCLWVLVPRYDALGAAFSCLIATAIHEVAGVAILRKHFGIKALTAVEAGIVVIACATLCAIATGIVARLPGALILAVLLVLGVARERALIGAIIGDLARMVRREN